MNKTVFGFGFQVFIAINLWFFLVYKLNRVDLFAISLVGVILLFIMLRGFTYSSDEKLLELECEPKKYLQYVEKKYKNSINNRHIAKAYGLLYDGEIEQARLEFDMYDSTELKYGDRFFLIYIKMKAKFAFYDNNLDEIESIINIYADKFVDNDPVIEYVKVLGYILLEDHKNVIDNIVVLIPKLKARNNIVELEYYLAVSYIASEQLEDAKAVLEFVGWKDYNLKYVEMCKELATNTFE